MGAAATWNTNRNTMHYFTSVRSNCICHWQFQLEKKWPLISEPWEASWTWGGLRFGELFCLCSDVQHAFSSGCFYTARGRGKWFRASSVGPEYWNAALRGDAKLLYLFMEHLKKEEEQQAFQREQRKSRLPTLSLPNEGVQMHRNVKCLPGRISMNDTASYSSLNPDLAVIREYTREWFSSMKSLSMTPAVC